MAVFTPLSKKDVQLALAQYGLELTAFTGIAQGSENSNFLVETTQANYVLTLFEKRTNPADLPWLCGLVQHLAAQGIPCPAPVQTSSESSLISIKNKPAVLVPFLSGKDISPTPDTCRQAGDMLAQIHILADVPTPKPNRYGPAFIAKALTTLPHTNPYTKALLAEPAWQQPETLKGLPTGAIHADYFTDNVLFTNGKLTGVIDFYFACTDTLAYDLAIALTDWGFTPDGRLIPENYLAFKHGYINRRPLVPAEHDHLPTLLRLACCRFLTTRLLDSLNPTDRGNGKPKAPKAYARRLSAVQSATNLATLQA